MDGFLIVTISKYFRDMIIAFLQRHADNKIRTKYLLHWISNDHNFVEKSTTC